MRILSANITFQPGRYGIYLVSFITAASSGDSTKDDAAKLNFGLQSRTLHMEARLY